MQFAAVLTAPLSTAVYEKQSIRSIDRAIKKPFTRMFIVSNEKHLTELNRDGRETHGTTGVGTFKCPFCNCVLEQYTE
jgi:hypothetical protein